MASSTVGTSGYTASMAASATSDGRVAMRRTNRSRRPSRPRARPRRRLLRARLPVRRRSLRRGRGAAPCRRWSSSRSPAGPSSRRRGCGSTSRSGRSPRRAQVARQRQNALRVREQYRRSSGDRPAKPRAARRASSVLVAANASTSPYGFSKSPSRNFRRAHGGRSGQPPLRRADRRGPPVRDRPCNRASPGAPRRARPRAPAPRHRPARSQCAAGWPARSPRRSRRRSDHGSRSAPEHVGEEATRRGRRLAVQIEYAHITDSRSASAIAAPNGGAYTSSSRVRPVAPRRCSGRRRPWRSRGSASRWRGLLRDGRHPGGRG